MELCRDIRAMEPELLAWYHALHRIPEVELHLPQTVAFVSARLTELGIEHELLPESSGIVAVIGHGAGAVVALRADMDALEVREETGLPFAAEGSCMHACGHDAHTAILLTAARWLKSHEDALAGRVVLLFQTAEEVLLGAKHMIAQGVLDKYAPAHIVALHTGSLCEAAEAGTLLFSQGTAFRSSNNFHITVTGKGGHAAHPQLTHDPIVAAARIVEALQSLISREVSPSVAAVASVTHIHAGAETYNVIPNEAVLLGGVRTDDPATRLLLMRRTEELARGTAEAMQCTARVEWMAGAPAVVNDPETAVRVERAAARLFPGETRWLRESIGGGEDAAYFFEKVPGCYVFLSSMGCDPDGTAYPHHHAKFRLNEAVLWRGAAVMTAAALELME